MDAGPVADAAPDSVVPTPSACASTGANIAPGPCQGTALSAGKVPSGCTPTVDGAPHLSEWQDAACFTVGTSDMNVYVKYAGGDLYMATIGNPTCGCGMAFSFLPSGGTTIGVDQFSTVVLDDPFNKNGDRGDYKISNGQSVMATPPAGIVTACPGGQPTPVPYEWKIPFAALQINAGSAHTFRMAITHASAFWPSGLTRNASGIPTDPATWGTFTSSTWK